MTRSRLRAGKLLHLGGNELPLPAGGAGFFLLLSASYVFWLPDASELRRKNPLETSFMRIKEKQAAARGATALPG